MVWRHSAAVAILVVAACGNGTATVGSTSAPESAESMSAGPAAELAAARLLWDEAGIATYRFQFRDDCGECDPDQRLPRPMVVWDGEASTPRDETVESLFDRVERAIADGRSVEVTYHPELGYPTDIAIDMEARAYDGGTHWTAVDLEPGLPGDDVSLADLREAQDVWDSQRPDVYEFLTAVACDCPAAGTLWTQVAGLHVVDWRVEFDDVTGRQLSPITVDDMFADLAWLFSSAEGIEDSGVRLTGSASYHPEMGYPEWIGVDVEVLDPHSEYADLGPRVVFSVHNLRPLQSDPAP